MSAPELPDLDRDLIREVFLRNGFTVKEGQTDLKPYVYAAGAELLALARRAQPEGEAPILHLSCALSSADVAALTKYQNTLIAWARANKPEGEAPQAKPVAWGTDAQYDLPPAYRSSAYHAPAAQHAEAPQAVLEIEKTGDFTARVVFHTAEACNQFVSGFSLAAQQAESGAQAGKVGEVIALLRQIEDCPDDGEPWVIAGKARLLVEALAAQSQGAQAAELCIGFANNDQSVHVNVVQRHGDGTTIVLYHGRVPAGDSFARFGLAAKAEAPAPRTELSKRIREAATADVTEKQARLLIGAAEEIERAQQAAAPGTMDDLLPTLGIRNDRDMLNYLMTAFDNEIANCERCGHAEPTKNMDSASFLRDYLAAAPSAPGTPEAPQTAAARDVPTECSTCDAEYCARCMVSMSAPATQLDGGRGEKP